MLVILLRLQFIDPSFPGENDTDGTFKCIFLNENVDFVALKFVPRDPIDNIPALVQIMTWHRTGNKPLSEPMTVRLLMHICVTQPQCVKLNVAKLEGLKHKFLVPNPILFIENR